MENASKVGVAVATGYLLGRSKKAKLALSVGTWMMGRRFSLDLKSLAREGLTQLASSEQAGRLAEEIRRGLLDAARAAAATAVTGRIDRFTDTLHDRTQALRESVGEGGEPGPEHDGQERRSTRATGGADTEQADRPRPRKSAPSRKKPDSEQHAERRRRPVRADSQQPDRPARKRTSSTVKTSRDRSGRTSASGAREPARTARTRD